MRTDATILADELSRTSDETHWHRVPEMEEFEATAEQMLVAGYHSMDEILDTSSYERAQLYKMLPQEKPSRARLIRTILDARSPPADSAAERSVFFKEIDIYAAIQAAEALSGIGDALKPRQEAAIYFAKLYTKGPGLDRRMFRL